MAELNTRCNEENIDLKLWLIHGYYCSADEGNVWPAEKKLLEWAIEPTEKWRKTYLDR